MKKILGFVVLVVCVSALMHAQQAKHGASVKFGQIEMAAYPQPAISDGARLPFLIGRAEKGKKEQFGVQFGGAAGSSPVIEFLAESGKVLKTVTVNDILGKGSAGGVKLLSTSTDDTGVRAEAVYEVEFSEGINELAIRALPMNEGSGNKEKLLFSFSLKQDVTGLAAVRVTLPVDGQAAAVENGFVVVSKTQPVSISAAVYPKPQSVVLEKNSLVIKCNVSSLSTKQSDAPLIWLVAEGAAASSAAGAKSEGAAAVKRNAKYASEPSLVIVTTANKEHTQPADTVTYSVVCTNIGLGSATDVLLSNEIPAGTVYLEESATGQGTDISVERVKSNTPVRGTAAIVRWKLKTSLQPGAEKIVTFKVVVQ